FQSPFRLASNSVTVLSGTFFSAAAPARSRSPAFWSPAFDGSDGDFSVADPPSEVSVVVSKEPDSPPEFEPESDPSPQPASTSAATAPTAAIRGASPGARDPRNPYHNGRLDNSNPL